MEQKRIIWIDWAKALLIYLMVVGHCQLPDYQHLYIYSFHMPAFFIISGYLYRRHNSLKTLKSFMLPILFFSLFNFAIYSIPKLIRGTLDTSNLLERCITPFIGNEQVNVEYLYLFPGVWFVIVLMVSRLLIGDIKFFTPILKYKYYVLGLLLLFLISEPFILEDNFLLQYKVYRVLPSLPFILLGYIIKDKTDISKINPYIVICMFILFIIITYIQGECNILNYKFGVSYIVFYINAVLGSFCLYYFCSKLHNSKIIEVISKGTLLILALQFNLILAFRMLFSKMGIYEYFPNTIYPWVVSLFILAVCYYPIKFLLKHYPALLGK